MPKPHWATARWMLNTEAHVWRFLMDIGMSLHRLAPPRPMQSTFSRSIPGTFNDRPGTIDLVFYCPPEYVHSRSASFPVVVNFHGGGMTIGKPEDDATWASAVVQQTRSVVVCVGYRLAPRHHFPGPVEDGVDAIKYLVRHATTLQLDPQRITVSGFSAGGNLCFTVPLLLASQQDEGVMPGTGMVDGTAYTIMAIIAFYPSVNFTTSRKERRLTNVRQDRNLAEFFTDLFDACYLYPDPVPTDSPFLSPAAASEVLLRHGLPQNIMFYTAEWDELQAEAQVFAQVLRECNKTVRYKMLEGQVHAWDRGTNPFREDKLRMIVYTEACTALARLLQGVSMHEEAGEGKVQQLHIVENINAVAAKNGHTD